MNTCQKRTTTPLCVPLIEHMAPTTKGRAPSPKNHRTIINTAVNIVIFLGEKEFFAV
jgi:hypothetical protein